MPNCSLRISVDSIHLMQGFAGSATYSLAIPSAPTLAGLVLYQQAMVLDAFAGNPASAVMSDAATAVIGS